MDSNEDVKTRVSGWVASQRKGEDSELPCYWSMYPVTSLTTAPQKYSTIFCENFHTEAQEESVEYLMEQMGNAPHVKYYAVRLRSKKGDAGPVCNFPNPYYKSNMAGIGNLPTMGDSSLAMTVIGLLQQQTEQRVTAKEESMNFMIKSLQIQQQQQLEQFKKEMKYENKIAALKDEIEGLKTAKASPFIEFISEIKPELMELAKYKLSGQIPYQEEEEEIGKHEPDKKHDSREDVVLEKAIEMLKNNVKKPHELIYKLAFVLENTDEETAKNMLNMLHAKYQEFTTKEAK